LTKSPSFPPTANYQLHRFLTDWSESDATWGMRTVSDEWMSPGAEAGTEYSTNVSGSALIGSTGTFPFSGTGMATDVEFWIANPTIPWWRLRILIPSLSTTDSSARASRRGQVNGTSSNAALMLIPA